MFSNKQSQYKETRKEAKWIDEDYFLRFPVRVHFAGEGFTGLKPANQVDLGAAAADQALQSGSARIMYGCRWHTMYFLERLNQLSSHAASQLHREPARHTE